MRKTVTSFLVSIVCAAFVFSGCELFGSDDDKSKPSSPVESLAFMVTDAATDYFSRDDEYTTSLTTWIGLRDGIDQNDVSEVVIYEPSEGFWRYDRAALDNRWMSNANEFAFWNKIQPSLPHAIELGTWKAVVTYRGREFEVPFEVQGFSANYNSGRYMYSAHGTDSDSEIIGGASSTGLTISDVGRLSFSYTIADSLVNELFVWLHDKDDWVGSSPAKRILSTGAGTFDADLTDRLSTIEIESVTRIRVITSAFLDLESGQAWYRQISRMYSDEDVANNMTAGGSTESVITTGVVHETTSLEPDLHRRPASSFDLSTQE